MSALPICLELPPLPPILQLTLPGEVTMEAINLAEIFQPALTPLVPIFQIVPLCQESCRLIFALRLGGVG